MIGHCNFEHFNGLATIQKQLILGNSNDRSSITVHDRTHMQLHVCSYSKFYIDNNISVEIMNFDVALENSCVW